MKKAPMYLQVADRYRKSHKEISVAEDTYLHVFAPVLIEFVNWVIQTAVDEGRNRLYFLSRDGYQMYLVAKELVKVQGLNIECRYINVSRYALRLPEYHLMQEKCLDRICIGGIDVTFEKVMKRAGLDDNEAKEIAKLCGYSEKYKKVISYKQVLALKEVLGKHGLFFEYVYRHSLERYSTAIGYLKQEGLFDEISYAIVDSGWVGTLHQTLNNLLISVGKKERIHGYYFGLYEVPKNDKELYKAYFFEPKKHVGRKVNFSNSLFEAVFTSTEGMTLRYSKTASGYEPVLCNGKNPNEKFIHRNITLLLEYIDIYKTQKKQECKNSEKIKVVEKLLKKMMGTPSIEEVEAYGNNMFSDDVLEHSLQKVAAELSEQEIRNQRFISKALIMLGLKKTIIHESAWIEGSIVRNGNRVHSNLRHARLYKYFLYIRKMFR